jgi:hypothetical protein
MKVFYQNNLHASNLILKTDKVKNYFRFQQFMVNTGSVIHKDRITTVLGLLEMEGYRVIDLRGKCPDAIAIKEKENVVAVEILKGNMNRTRADKKSLDYHELSFDNVFIFEFDREGNPRSYCIRDNFIDSCLPFSSEDDMVCRRVLSALGGRKPEDILPEPDSVF